ncbi:hypothetical protein GQ473_00085 [archaeon]|nr:hypothetical protein [archaeon]
MSKLRGWLRRKVDEEKEYEFEFKEEVKRFRIGMPKKVVLIPNIKSMEELDVKYPLIPPFTYAHLYWSDEDKEIIYSIIQPELDTVEKELVLKIEEGLSKVLEKDLTTLKKKSELIDYIQKKTLEIIEEYGLKFKPGQYTRVMYYVYVNFVGLNRIEPLMFDSYIEDIGCDGVDIPLYVTHKKYGNIKTSIKYSDPKELEDFVVKLAERCGRYISYAEPILDGSLPDGSRINATMSNDITTNGPTYSMRKFRDIPYSAIEIIRNKTVSSEIMAYLWYAMEHKSNILICGGTGAGKTSLLNSIVSFIPPQDKIVSIEDTREINLTHENWIPSVSRSGFGTVTSSGTKYGEVTMFDLLKESFRQNPDYVIVGEVRGKEAAVLFQGMASGHPSIGTIHGGSVDDIIKRMETPPISLPPTLIESLDIVLVITHASQCGKSARRLKEVAEIESVDANTGKSHSILSFTWSPVFDRHERHHSYILEKISMEYGVPLAKIDDEIKTRTRMMDWMLEKKIHGFKEVAHYISMYYKEKDKVVELMGKDGFFVDLSPDKITVQKSDAETQKKLDEDEILL